MQRVAPISGVMAPVGQSSVVMRPAARTAIVMAMPVRKNFVGRSSVSAVKWKL
jgi:hypothetical protein